MNALNHPAIQTVFNALLARVLFGLLVGSLNLSHLYLFVHSVFMVVLCAVGSFTLLVFVLIAHQVYTVSNVKPGQFLSQLAKRGLSECKAMLIKTRPLSQECESETETEELYNLAEFFAQHDEKEQPSQPFNESDLCILDELFPINIAMEDVEGCLYVPPERETETAPVKEIPAFCPLPVIKPISPYRPRFFRAVAPEFSDDEDEEEEEESIFTLPSFVYRAPKGTFFSPVKLAPRVFASPCPRRSLKFPSAS